jgi:hypothetical protein
VLGGASRGANGGGSEVRFEQGKVVWSFLDSHSTCPTPAVLDKTRTALIFLSALNHFEFFVQSESFVEFFQLNSLKIYFSATPVTSFSRCFDSCSWGFAASVKSGLNFQKKGHFGQIFFHFHRERKKHARLREKKQGGPLHIAVINL